jgi:MFS superfamily sulfate permease-like transporter
LAGVVIVYSVGLIEVDGFRAILRVRRTEFIWALVALAGVVLLGTLKGILVAIVVSLVALGQQVASPPVYGWGETGHQHLPTAIGGAPGGRDFPGLLLLRVEGGFLPQRATDRRKVESLMEEASPKVVAIDLSGVFDLEYTALKALIEAEKRLRENGVSVWLVGLAPAVLETVQRSSLGATLGRERMHFNLEVAVQQYGILEKSA